MEQLAETLDSGAEEAADTSTADEATQDTSFSPDDTTDEVTESAEETSSEESAEEETEEIERNGKKYAVPKSLKGEFLMQQDYTRKTQEVAETRRAVEAERVAIQQQAAAQQQFIAEYAEAFALDKELKQYQAVKWSELIDSDPVQAMKLDRQMRELQQRRDLVVASVTQKQQAQALQTQQETAKRMQEGRAVLEREIKGWSPEVAAQLAGYGKEIGFSDAELTEISDPRAVKLLHKAWQFDQLMKKQAVPKEKPAAQEKPVTRITASKGTATKDPSKMTDAEFAAWRKRQIAQRP